MADLLDKYYKLNNLKKAIETFEIENIKEISEEYTRFQNKLTETIDELKKECEQLKISKFKTDKKILQESKKDKGPNYQKLQEHYELIEGQYPFDDVVEGLQLLVDKKNIDLRIEKSTAVSTKTGLFRHQEQCIDLFTDLLYNEVNKGLKNDDIETYKSIIIALDFAMAYSLKKHDLETVYCKTTLTENEYEEYKVGKKFYWRGFTIATQTKTPTEPKDDKVVFHIDMTDSKQKFICENQVIITCYETYVVVKKDGKNIYLKVVDED